MKSQKKQSQVDRVIEFLAASPGNRTITPSIAARRYGIVNIRSVMTKVRDRVSNWGSANWDVTSTKSARGVRHYALTRN